jgi:hypothetical protein
VHCVLTSAPIPCPTLHSTATALNPTRLRCAHGDAEALTASALPAIAAPYPVASTYCKCSALHPITAPVAVADRCTLVYSAPRQSNVPQRCRLDGIGSRADLARATNFGGTDLSWHVARRLAHVRDGCGPGGRKPCWWFGRTGMYSRREAARHRHGLAWCDMCQSWLLRDRLRNRLRRTAVHRRYRPCWVENSTLLRFGIGDSDSAVVRRCRGCTLA